VVDADGDVLHVVHGELAVGGRVYGKVDWSRRFDHMQQHTGQHLLSAVLHELYGHATVAVHFGHESATLDLDTADLEHGRVVEAEARANDIVTENRAVEVSFEAADQAIGLRKASSRQGTLRIVTIRDLDRSACGGTHVRATGEIGPILIRRLEKVKKNVRLEFLCGTRAVRRARADLDLLSRLAGRFSASAEELPALMEAQRVDLKAAMSDRRELERSLAAYRARELHAATEPGKGGVRRIVVREDGGVERLRPLAEALAALPGSVLVGWTADPPAVLLATSADSGVDAGTTLKGALAAVGGRGGGNARLAQGTAPSVAALEQAIAAL
jgi:alanyl-tRNA synthetase